MGDWSEYGDGTFRSNDTEVDFGGGDSIVVRCTEGSGYEQQHTSTSFPIGLMVKMIQAAGYNVTPQEPDFCVACKRIERDMKCALFPQYVKMFADNLAEHRREVHGEVAE